MPIVDLSVPYGYERMMRDVDALGRRYPHILSVESLGRSLDGREIPSMSVGRGEQNILLTAGVHGRESVNPAVLMGMAERYLAEMDGGHDGKHGHGSDVKHSHGVVLAIMPMVNPDGHEVALHGFGAIRSQELGRSMAKMGIRHQEWKYNARGIDVNRNFPSRAWSRASGTDEPGTEPETKAVMSFLTREGSMGYIDFHSRGEVVYYYRNQMDEAYNKGQERLAQALGRITGYRLAHPSEETEVGDVGGNTVQFYSERTGRPAITIETLSEATPFPLPCESQAGLAESLYATPFVFLDGHR